MFDTGRGEADHGDSENRREIIAIELVELEAWFMEGEESRIEHEGS